MKIVTQGILAKKKIVLIFLLAILLPSLIVGYLSLSAFSKRREGVKRLLESNLWITGEAVLRSVETALLEYEKEALRPENFARFTGLEGPDQFLRARCLGKRGQGDLPLWERGQRAGDGELPGVHRPGHLPYS